MVYRYNILRQALLCTLAISAKSKICYDEGVSDLLFESVRLYVSTPDCGLILNPKTLKTRFLIRTGIDSNGNQSN